MPNAHKPHANKLESIVDDMVNTLISFIPEGAKILPQEIKAQFKLTLHSAMKKLDLVSREEFDAQVKVLQRTRKKVDALEKKSTPPHKTDKID